MSEQYRDLGITQSQDGDYWDIVIPDLDFDTTYALQAAWVYTDKAKGTSELSDRFNFTTPEQEGLLAPRFTSEDLYGENSILYISWNGQDSGGNYYLSSILKQVNIWIKGGDFGDDYVRFGTFGDKAGTIQINSTKASTYCVKLQAESKIGALSSFSSEFCLTLLKQPKAPSDVRHTWDASGNLTIFWKFDPTFKDVTNDNSLADSFGIQLLDETNDVDATWWTAVETDKIPPLEQKITVSANQLQKVFGQFTAYEIDYSAFLYTRDKNLQTSFVTGYALAKYTDPLTPPVITVATAPMAYKVSYTSNSAFDQIYIEESLDSGTTWTLVTVSPANPVLISTLNTLERSVRSRFSKKLGGFTGYSNTLSVTPTKIDPTDTTPPSIPSITSGSATHNTIPVTITTSDDTTKGFRLRYKLSTDTLYSPDIVLYAGASTSHTIKDLDPNKTYQISVAAYDGANNTSDYSSDITATTSATVVPVVSNILLSALSYGLYATWTAPSSPTVPIDNYRIQLYDSSNSLLQTVYSFTTVVSFSGLKASTTYYVKVNAIDITGNSGNQVTSSNITLNAAGGASDGLAPTSSPTPTVTPLYQALEVKWSPTSNIDLVTYEVHVSSTNSFTTSLGTKSLETKGTFAIIKTLPGTSTSLTYGTTYYVKIIAKDFDGPAPESIQSSAQTLQVDNGDLAADSVRANVIKAGTITATEINSDSLLVGKLFKVGAGESDTHAIKIDASGSTTKLYSGAGIYSDSGTPFYLDTTGKFSLQDRLFFSSGVLTVKGAIDATSGTISGAITLNNGTMKIGGNVNSTFDGIHINANSYWYSTGLFAVGTSTTKFLEWTGAALKVTGEINAQSGTITGNLNVTTGALIAGTVGGPRVQVNSSGLFAYGNLLVNGSPVLTETTQIIGNAATDAPTFITTRALIGNWTVQTDKITGGGLTLNSSGSIIGTSGTSYIGIKPRQSAGTDIVLWSGNTDTPAINSATSGQAGFQVNANGQLYATGAIISGKITVESGSSLGGLLNDTSKVYYSATTPTAPATGFKVGDGWVDTANSNQLKVWNGTAWVVAQDSEAVRSIANLKTKTTFGSIEPSSPIAGDVWFDTNSGINYFKVYNGTSFVRMKDSDITLAQSAAATAQSSADSKAQTTFGSTAPVSPKSGDIWFDTSLGYFKRYNGTTFDRMKDADITAAMAAAVAAQSDAGQALNKAAKFGIDGSLVSNLIIENSGAAIYSKYNSGGVIAKDSYASTNAGFYMGWDNQAGVLYPAFNIGNANAYMKWSNYDQTLRIKGNISLNAGSDINGTPADTVVSNASTGATALQPDGNLTGSVGGTAVATIKSGATAGSTSVQPGNGVSLKNDGSKMINQIDLFASGIKISSATSGTRVEMSNSGLYLYKGTSTTPTVALDAATGDAQFSGIVNASGGSFSGNISASGTITGGAISGATITGSTITTTNTGFNRVRLNSSNSSIEFLNSLGGVTGTMYSFGGGEVIIQNGDKTALGYPSSSGYLSVSPTSVTIGRTNSAGSNIGGLTVDNTSATFTGVNVNTIQGAPIGTGAYYMRNIGMGTGAKATTDTDGYRGDIWIQYT